MRITNTYNNAVNSDAYIMKKTLITLLACATLGFAYGEDGQKSSGFGLEVNGGYNFALKDFVKLDYGSNPKIDTYGVDISAVYAFNENHSINLRFGWAMGDDTVGWSESDAEEGVYSYSGSESDKYELRTISIMPGYRYTHRIGDKGHAFFGVNAGIAQVHCKDTWSGYFTETYNGEVQSDSDGDSLKKDKWGFAWSAEVGCGYAITPKSNIQLSVQLMHYTTRLKYEGSKSEAQLSIGTRIGCNIIF